MIPQDCRYTDQHEWIRVVNGVGTVGITDYAQSQLGDMTFIEMPDTGRQVSAGEETAAAESCKAAAGVYTPASGEIVETNDTLADDPAKVNTDPFGEGWLFKVALSDESELDKLMDAAAYEKFLGGLE